MLLDLFKQKQATAGAIPVGTSQMTANPNQPTQQMAAKPIPIPAAATSAVPIQAKMTAPAAQSVAQSQAQPQTGMQAPVQQPIQPSPIAAKPISSAPLPTASSAPGVSQPVAATIQPSMVAPQAALNIDDIYPVILRKVKEEFKDVAGEAEKLRDMDTKMVQVLKQFQDFKKFIDDSKTNIEELKTKTEKFDVALYELLTNQFNPFIKKEGEVPERKITEVENKLQNIQTQNSPPQNYVQSNAFPPGYPSMMPMQQQSPVLTHETAKQLAKEAFADKKESLMEDYEQELRKIMDKTKKELYQEVKGPTIPDKTLEDLKKQEPLSKQSMQSEQKSKETTMIPTHTLQTPAKQNIIIADALSENQENVFIPAQNKLHEEQFIQNAKKLTPGIKQDALAYEEFAEPDRTLVKERIVVEDVLNLPKEGTENHEVTETIAFHETWNDPEAQHLDKTPPKFRRFDLKDLLGKFMAKHDSHDKHVDEYLEGNAIHQKNSSVPLTEHKMQQSSFNHGVETVQKNQAIHEVDQGDIVENMHQSTSGVIPSRDDSIDEMAFIAEKERITQMDIRDNQKYFWLTNGKMARNIPELVMALTESDDRVFNHHTTNGRNDFSNWIRGVFGSDVIANKLTACKSKEEMIRLLS